MGPTLTSAIVTAQHPYKIPAAPSEPQAIKVSKESVTLKWSEPTNDGGSPVTGYQMEHKDRNSILWQVCLALFCKSCQKQVCNARKWQFLLFFDKH